MDSIRKVGALLLICPMCLEKALHKCVHLIVFRLRTLWRKKISFIKNLHSSSHNTWAFALYILVLFINNK